MHLITPPHWAHVRGLFFYVSHHIFMADAADGAETKSVMCRGITGCGGRVFSLAGYQYQYLLLYAFSRASFCISGGRSSGQPGMDREHVSSHL